MRKIFFWLHLCLGIAAGIVILIMSVTGVLLTYEKQMVAWMDLSNLPPITAGSRLPLESLLESARGTDGKLPSSFVFSADLAKPVQFTVGRDLRYVDPANGKPLGTGHAGIRQFFRSVTEWHRYVGASGASRPTGKALTGAANLAFLFIVLSGLYLWLPKVWTKVSLRAIAWFRGGLGGKARDFNWHNVVGVWCFLPLLLIVLGATVISYSWATNLVFTMTGTSPQPPPPAPAQKPGPHPYNVTGLNQLWSRAVSQAGDWRTITLRLPASDEAPVTFVIDGGYAGQPQLRTTLTLDRASGEIRTTERYDDFNLGRKARTWLRFIHTGEYYGLLGQTIAGLATAGTVMLVYTGVALAWRRLVAWRTRTARVAAKV